MPALKKRKISHEKLVEKEEVSEDASSSGEEVHNSANEDEATKAPKTFKDLGLIPQLCEACETLGYKAPTAIQAESIPLALQVFYLYHRHGHLLTIIAESGFNRISGDRVWKDGRLCATRPASAHGQAPAILWTSPCPDS